MTGNKREYPSYYGETTIKIIEFGKYFTKNVYEIIQSWGKNKYPVGGLIFEDNKEVWDDFRAICERYDVNISSGGLMFAIIWAVRHLKAVIPIAEEIKHNPFGLADDLNVMCSELIENMDRTKWVDKSNELVNDIREGVENKILLDIQKKVNK